jgi:hypothetical protein
MGDTPVFFVAATHPTPGKDTGGSLAMLSEMPSAGLPRLLAR